MRVLITGAKGFLGSNLARWLASRGHAVGGLDLNPPETAAWEACAHGRAGFPVPEGEAVSLTFDLYDADVSRHAEVARAFDGFKPDVVVHLAAVSTMQVASEEPMRAWRTNVMGTAVVLELCRARSLPVIVASSDKAYGWGRPYPFDEGQTPLRPQYPYDVSKACQDLMALSYHHEYGLPVVVTRAANYYGPADLHWHRLVPRTIRNAYRGQNPVLYEGRGETRREWLHVSDAAAAYEVLAWRLLFRPGDVAGEAFNIGTGDSVTNREMITYLLDAADRTDLLPTIEPVPFKELDDEALDSQKIRELGWRPAVKLGDGLASTWEWYRNYFAKVGT